MLPASLSPMWELLPDGLVRDEIRWGVCAPLLVCASAGARRATKAAQTNNRERQYRADQRHGQVGRFQPRRASLK